jgi:acyl-CoA thioesterase I
MEPPTQLWRGWDHLVRVLAPPQRAVFAMGAAAPPSYGWDMTSTPRFSRPLLAAVAVLSALALTACGGAQPDDEADTGTTSPRPTSSTSTASPSATSTDTGLVYVAVGASETVGIGADDPQRDAWPVVLHRTALRKAQFVNLGVSGSTVGQAINEQLPAALAAEPDVATVWLAVNDLTHLVPVQAYEQQLMSLVHKLRRDGRTQVLVGNMPAVERLPAFRACLPGAPADAMPCQLPVVPEVAEIRAIVTTYNAAIARVAKAEGATLVDLSKGRDLNKLTGTDGFHPSTAGHRLVAAQFARALKG